MQTLNHMTPRDHRLHTDELRRTAGLRRWAMQTRTLHLRARILAEARYCIGQARALRGAGA